MFRSNHDWLSLPHRQPEAVGRKIVLPPRAVIESLRQAAREGGFVCDGQLLWRSPGGTEMLAVTPLHERGSKPPPGWKLALGVILCGTQGLRYYHGVVAACGGGVVLRTGEPRRQTSGLDLAGWATKAVDLLALKRDDYAREVEELRKMSLPLTRWREMVPQLARDRHEQDKFTWVTFTRLDQAFRRERPATAWEVLLLLSRIAYSYLPHCQIRRLDQLLNVYEPFRKRIWQKWEKKGEPE